MGHDRSIRGRYPWPNIDIRMQSPINAETGSYEHKVENSEYWCLDEETRQVMEVKSHSTWHRYNAALLRVMRNSAVLMSTRSHLKSTRRPFYDPVPQHTPPLTFGRISAGEKASHLPATFYTLED
jgi:hypothetical protein